MRVRKTVAVACAVASAGIAAQAASAEKYLIPDPTGLIFGDGGGFIIGTEPGKELNGGLCNRNETFMPGYYHGWISVSDPPGNFRSDDDCPTTDDPTSNPPDPPVDPNNPPDPNDPPDPPSTGNPFGFGYQKQEDPTGVILGDGGGIVAGNTRDRGYEAGLCQKNTAAPNGYAFVHINGDGVGSGQKEGCAGDAPLVKGREATAVTSTTVTMNGVVNPNRYSTKYWFEYGLTPAYGSRTGERGLSATDSDYLVTLNASGAEPNTTYHYRVVAKNDGGTTRGPDITFTTAP